MDTFYIFGLCSGKGLDFAQQRFDQLEQCYYQIYYGG